MVFYKNHCYWVHKLLFRYLILQDVFQSGIYILSWVYHKLSLTSLHWFFLRILECTSRLNSIVLLVHTSFILKSAGFILANFCCSIFIQVQKTFCPLIYDILMVNMYIFSTKLIPLLAMYALGLFPLVMWSGGMMQRNHDAATTAFRWRGLKIPILS